MMEQERKPLFSSLTLREIRPDIEEHHYLRWFIHDKVEFEIECKHEPFPVGSRFICYGDSVREDPEYFAESYAGDRVPLRDGPVKIWWEGEGEDCELFWLYEDDDNTASKG